MKILIQILLASISTCSVAQGFNKLSVKQTGIEFSNTILEDDTLNGLSYLYLYNGGGVAVGDINNDGLEDLYFTGNQVDDKLYLNQGGLKFKDVTAKFFKDATFDFHTGATMVDINGDGWLDIYVSAAGPAYDGEQRRNKLFINQKGKSFTDQASLYGLDDSLNTTQAAFFDADNDGDLDAYLLNHVYLRKNTQYRFQFNKMRKVLGYDRLMINEDGFFKDKSIEFGVLSNQYGQGVVVSDFNQDGYPDIYVANDFESSDKLYINKAGSGFSEMIKTKTKHIPLFAMGVDAADFNNDGLVDLMTVDMVAEDHVKSKKNMGGMSSENFWNLVKHNQHYQYMFNTLQLNLGEEFIEVGQLAGVSKTDWSWAPLFADFDNDGFQDLFVSNGYLRDLRNNDFTAQYDTIIQISKEFIPFEELQQLIPSSTSANYIFKNNGNLSFKKMTDQWGMDESINVNGAVYADLDNDGDLDLICNASNQPSYIMENLSQDNNFIQIKLIGPKQNRFCFGARLEVYIDSTKQIREVYPTRGFQSSVSTKLHFGLGKTELIDSIVVRLNGNRAATRYEVKANQELIIDLSTIEWKLPSNYSNQKTILTEVQLNGLKAKHTEIEYDDFEKEILLPHKMSQLGPFIHVDDMNGDGLSDCYLSGARGSKGALLVQTESGDFIEKSLELFKTNFLSEEMESVFFDADNDGDLDVYVVMGSNEEAANHPSYQDQLYLNVGDDKFSNASKRLPQITISGQKVLVEDINADGWLDLLVFGRQTPGQYPSPTSSYLLMNEKGNFVDRTLEYFPEFKNLGMVTDAVFSNIDSDKELELLIVGEWMPVTIFDQLDGVYKNVTHDKGLSETVGWWNTIVPYIKEDGQQRFILGNLGLNNKFHPSVSKPLHIYQSDFDENGSLDIVLAKAEDEILYPIRGRQCSSEQMPFIAQQFQTYEQFAIADVNAIYTKEKLEQALHYEAHTFASSLLTIKNDEVILQPLPQAYQTGPIKAVIVNDCNEDGKLDVFCFGNQYETEVETIRYDGNPSLFYDGSTDFSNPKMLGIIENIKSAKFIEVKNELYILLGINNGDLKTFKVNSF